MDLLQSPKTCITGPKVCVVGRGLAVRCVWAPPGTSLTNKKGQSEKKKEASNTFVLPTITTLCTYIIWGGKKTTHYVSRLGLLKIIMKQ
jgi:hypothetical protein